ncbi:MAG TPA: hypothetical protein VKR59_14075 [Terriglobales bacterium]|nr:hypothetical protein [Terriglobales bacterium]
MKTYQLVVLAAAALLLGTSGIASANSSGCLAHRPKYLEGKIEVHYDAGCTGHDEPELDPVSSAPGSARDLTWTAVLPSGGAFPVSATGPTFWFGGTVTDPSSLFEQAFVELQFYPDSIVTNCTPGGGFVVKFAPDTYSVCSPVWKLTQTGQQGVFHETAAFNAMLTDGTGASNPLIMHAGDTITVHWFTTPAADGFHVTVTDLTTGGSGTIVLNSKTDGPLMPAFDTQTIGNALAWGAVFDTPNAFVWEIGHTSDFSSPSGQFCVPGETNCLSYDAPAWAGTSPIQIKSVSFGDGSTAKSWAAVSDLGGKAEVLASCSVYGGPFCIYPWYTLGTSGFHFGVDFPDTIKDYGQANQFQQTANCGGPFGPDSTYCATILK